MSIDPTTGSDTTRFRTDDVPVFRTSRPPASNEGLDSELVDQTKNQIRALVQEIADLAKSNCNEDEFYQGFLTRTTSALASIGGIIWTRPENQGPLKLLYHINLKHTNLADNTTAQLQHSLLLEQLLNNPEPTIVPPNSGAESVEQAGNPTDLLLIFAPLVVDGQTVGLVEILQRPGGGPATQRGYLRFLAQMAEIASDFLKTRRLRSFQIQQELWRDLDLFSKSVHSSLDVDQTAFVIANEGRRIIGCDRVSVAIKTGARFEIAAVSGLDTVERRADQIKRLARLASTVARAHEPLWYRGDASKLAPQIETQLHAYIDLSHAKTLAVLPLHDHRLSASDASSPQTIIAALIVEQLADASSHSLLEKRTEIVAEHAQSALANSLEHNRIFLMPLWKKLGWLLSPFQGARFPKTAAIIAAGLLAVAALLIVPYPFELGSSGELIAETQADIYAQLDGRLTFIYEPASLDEAVPAGFVLAEMENSNLDAEIEKISGELKQNREQVRKLNQLQSEKLEKLEQITLIGDLMKAEENVASLERELLIKQNQAEQLILRSPISGRIANWQLQRNLLGRPVQVGQNLMTVVATDSRWQLEILIPEKRMGHLIEYQAAQTSPLQVTFTLASNPGQQFTGHIVRVDQTLNVFDDSGNSGRALVAFDNQQIPTEILRSGTRVTAKIDCGTRSVGYVLFHEFFESIRSGFLFWF